MFYKLVEEFSDIITAYSVFEFNDSSLLHIKDFLFIDGKRKYSYHWQDAQGRLITRWDNSPHHKGLPTFPSEAKQFQGMICYLCDILSA